MANRSGDPQAESFQTCDLYTNARDNRTIGNLNALVNVILSLSAVLGNTLFLIAIRKTTSLGPPSKVLLRSLALADLGVGLVVQPFFILRTFLDGYLPRCVTGLVFDFSSGHLLFASFMTIMVITIDKCMAVQLKLRYRIVVTLRRSVLVVGAVWFTALPYSVSFFVSTKAHAFSTLAIIPLSFFVSFVAFVKIRFTLRQQSAYAQYCATKNDQEKHQNDSNVLRYKNSVRTMLYVYSALLIAYVPAWLVILTRMCYGRTTATLRDARDLSLTFVFMNSTVNPALYLWRIKELRALAFKAVRFVSRKRKVESMEMELTEPRRNHPRSQTVVESIN